MNKLINGRPMNELKLDGRKVAVISSYGDCYIAMAHTDMDLDCYLEWAEIVKPEPKPDANGWWKMEEKQPEHLQIVLLCSITDYVKRVAYCEDLRHSYSYWKLWEGPCE